MEIVVFGASGRTGEQIVQRALAQGHRVTVFVRNPASLLQARPPNLRVLQGDVFDAAAVADAIADQQAVLSALGARSLSRKAAVLTRAMPNILAGMRQHSVNRIIVLGAAGVARDAGKYQNALTNIALWTVKHTLLRNPFADQTAQERLLASSGADYTIVRPPRLTDAPSTGKYRVVPDALPSGGLTISRVDVADFMLQQLTDPRFHRQGPYIAD